ncbi:MAG TPA: tetratricopeptide repeat protein [Pirellulales bacterium]|nr:tetratricopeptide repeat protein [Pirellulales bacterium]
MFALTLLAYLPASQGDFIWDDELYVTKNATLRSAEGLRDIWLHPQASPQYYPLVFTSFWLEYHCWGLRPLGYHAINILLHAANAVLFWRLLARLEVPGAWLAAAIFVLHPVQVESVAWISERKNVLSMFFYLAAATVFLRWDEAGQGHRSGIRENSAGRRARSGIRENSDRAPPANTGILTNSATWRTYGLSLGLFLAALLSKTVTASLPAALLLVAWWRRGRITRGDVWPLAPMFALGLLFGGLTAVLERVHVGATTADLAFTPVERLLIAGRAFWFYVGKLVWPARLTFIYPRWTIDATLVWQYVFPLAGLAVLWWGRARWGRGPIVAVLFFAGTLVPALGFFNVFPMRYSFVADHFQYLASLGPIALAAAGMVRLWGRAAGRGRWIVVAAAASWLALLGGLTWRQGHVYRDEETLWRRTQENNPYGYLPNHNLAAMLVARGELAEAARHYRLALEANSTSDLGGLAYCGLGTVVDLLGDRAEAVRCFERALAIDRRYVAAYKGLAKAAHDEGKFDDSIRYLLQALRIAPDDRDAHANLVRLYSLQGNADLARRHKQAAEAIQAWRIEMGLPP